MAQSKETPMEVDSSMDADVMDTSVTTISTVAVQAGKAKIVLAILKSAEWIKVRIQQMEPDLMEVGTTLEEAKQLRREHDELLYKLGQKQKDVAELLARSDDLANQNTPYQEVYAAMAESLSEAWRDLNAQLDYRKMLLDQSIAFHESANQFSYKMTQAQENFTHVGLAQDVETAKRYLQIHSDLKKSILESSMQTLQEGQLLLDRIRQMGMHADVQNRHATTAACYGIEHLLELLQDRRRHLEDLWLQRKIKLEQHLQLLLLDLEVKKVSDWFAETGDKYLDKQELGDSLTAAQILQDQHMHFELQARDIQDTIIRLIRTADQLVHSAHYNAEGVKSRLKEVDQKCENFIVRLDNRRKNIALAVSFFHQAQAALSKLNEIEVQLTTTDLPRNSQALAEQHSYLSSAITEVSTPALHEGRVLLERVRRVDPGVQGVAKTYDELKEKVHKLQDMCLARYQAGERSQQYNQFHDICNNLTLWLGQIGQATLSQLSDMGSNLAAARDFLETHERLADDLGEKRSDLKAVSNAAEELVKSGDQEATAAMDRVNKLKKQWNELETLVDQRIKLALSYVAFHKRAQQLAIQMDTLEQYLKIEKVDATLIADSAVTHKEQKYNEMSKEYKEVESKGKTFIGDAQNVSDDKLDTRRAIFIVETILNQFSERKYLVTEYYEHWKVHVTSGKEFKTQWHQFIQDARKTIDWVMRIEEDFFPVIAGELGDSKENTEHYKRRLEEYLPSMKKAQEDIERHLKTAEMLSLKGDTHGQKEQIVNELLKVHTRFQARITEYQVLLNMTSKFFKTLEQLDKLIADTEKAYKSQDLPNELSHAQLLLKEHHQKRDQMDSVINTSHNQGEEIVVRVRQQDSEAIAKDEVQKVLQLTEERRKAWENAWEDQRAKLEQNLQVCQFYFDLRQIHNELDELHRQLSSRRGNYGSSLSSVRMTSQAFKNFELSVQLIESKIKQFSGTADVMIRDQHYDSRRIRHEVDEVERKWAAFLGSIGDYRSSLDRSEKFFELMEQCEVTINDAGQFLLNIGKKATECTTSADAMDLINQLDVFKQQFAKTQDAKLGEMENIAVQLWGPVNGPAKMQHIVDKNQDILNSFIKAVEELAVLRENLLKKEQILAQLNVQAELHAPKVPRFVIPLQNADIAEGLRLTLECKLECATVPTIEWFKDDVPIKSADYITYFHDMIATLTIEETFADDTAKYTCKASSAHGSSDTSAMLKVKESTQKVVKPDFAKHLKSVDVPDGSQFTFECTVSGVPAPVVSWYREDTCIDSSPDYVTSNINGVCTLKIRKVTKQHSARYVCKATNSGGEAASSARLNVISAKKPYFHEPLHNKTVQEGKPAKLECRFTAEPRPSIQWLRNDQPILQSAVFKMTVQDDYTCLDINGVFPEDTGTYTVIAKNMAGETRTSCLLTVEGQFPVHEEVQQQPVRPAFTHPLKDQTAKEGSRTRIECIINAYPYPDVIWYHNDQPVKESPDFQLMREGDKYALVIKELYLEDSGDYKIVAKNNMGQVEGRCRLIVDALVDTTDGAQAGGDVVPPKFTQLLKDIEGNEGESVRFDCRVIGYPVPRVKWYRGRQEIKPSNDFQITSSRELHSLTIPEVFKEDAGNFMVKATNSAGEAKCYASLIVKQTSDKHIMKTRLVEESHMTQKIAIVGHTPPEFTKLFKDMRVRPGESCRLEVHISGNPKPKVQWLFNNEPVVSPDYQIGSSGDVYSLYIPEVFDEDAGRFSVSAENDSGKATCSALLVIVDDAGMNGEMASPPPTPQAHTVPPKTFIPESIAPVPAPAVKAPPPPPPQPKPKTPPPKVDVEMDLPVPPKFMEPLKTLAAEEGTRVSFTGKVDGKPAPTIKWYKEGTEISDRPDYEISYSNGRVTLTIPEVFEEDAGKYVCSATNAKATVNSTAELIVKASLVPPQFADRLTSKEVREGDSVRFTVKVSGKPPPEVTWYREGSQIVSSPDFEIQQDGDVHALYIPEVFYEDSGKFTVKAENRAGQTTCTAELIVEAPAQAPQAPPAPPIGDMQPKPANKAPLFVVALTNQPLAHGQTAYFECRVSAYPPPEILWTRRGHPLVDKARYKSTYDQYSGVTTLTILNLCTEDEGEYTCTAINNQGEVSTSGTLLGQDRYQAWLREQQGEKPMTPKDQQRAMVSELDSKLAAAPVKSPGAFYRPMSERAIDSALEHQAPVYDKPVEPDQGFKVSSFEKRLEHEIELREGRVHPKHHVQNDEAFSDQVPVGQALAPTFDQKLKNFQLMEGSDATFVCKVNANPLPHVQWFHNGRLIRPSNRYEMKMTRDGYVTLRIRVAFPEDQGHYTCCATNIVGRDTCSAELYIEGIGIIDETSYVSEASLKRMTRSPGSRRGSQEPGGVSEKYYRPVFRKIPADQEVPEGKVCRFDSVVSGRPMPEIFWFRDDTQVHDDANHKIVVNEDGIHSLIIHATQNWDAGLYTCVARNRGGEDRFQVKLNVTARMPTQPPRFVERMVNLTVKEGDPVDFHAEATGHPTPLMSWQKDGKHLEHDKHYLVDTEGGRSSLYIENAEVRDSAWFQCTAVNIGGTATNRSRLMVQPAPKKPEPERKLYIPKRTTPTPTRDITSPKPPDAKRPTSEPPKRSRADIVLSPSPTPRDRSLPVPWRHVDAPVDEPMMAPYEAPSAAAPPAQPVELPKQNQLYMQPSKPQPMKPVDPKQSDLLKYIQEQDKEKPAPDVVDARPMAVDLRPPPIQAQEPDEEDVYNKEKPRPPKFKTHIKSQTNLMEAEPTHFECKLVPMGDPDMVVEWYKDGVLLRHGSRFKLTHDFGFVALDLQWVYPEDSGVYSCKATNKYGQDVTQATVKCYPKESVIYDSQLPEGDQSVAQLQLMEDQIRRDNLRKERIEDGPEPAPPLFDVMPDAVQVEEGDTAKFMCRVSGHPRPRLTWWVNGTIIVNGHRFRLKYDGHMNVLEIPKVREYDNGTIRVVAKNPLGEAECSTTLIVIPHEDWRSRLKQAPKSTVAVELDKRKAVELRSIELDSALKRPRTTVTELRAFERSTQEKAQSFRDTEVSEAYHTINLRHAELTCTDASKELRQHEPNIRISNEAHIDRAKKMLDMEIDPMKRVEVGKLGRGPKSQEPPSMTKPLMNAKAKEGQTVKMEVNFTGFPYPTIQWYREGLEIHSSRDFQITTLNNKSFLLIPEVFLEDAGVFIVKASNQFGMTECKSVLTVTEDKTKVRDTAPEFKVQMRDLNVKVGEPATFDIQVSGAPKPEVYWAKDGKRIFESKRWKFFQEEDHYTFLIYEVGVTDKGVYECIVVNKLGKATCTANLNVDGQVPMSKQNGVAGQQAPQLIQPLKDQQVNEGEPATFTCKVLAVPDPVVQWYYNNQLIKPSKYFQMHSQAGNHSLHIAGAFPEDEGLYKCTAMNQAGEVTCIAHLKVFALSSEPEPEAFQAMDPPRFARPINSVEGKPGHPAHFVVEFEGQPLPQVTWFREGHQIQHSEDFQILQEGNKCVLFIKEVFPEDRGVFTCRATNPAGVAECSAELFIEDPTLVSQAQMQLHQGPPQTAPHIIKAPSPVREVTPGNTTKLMVQLAAYPPPKFNWIHNGCEILPSQRFKVSYDNGIVTLIILNVQPQDAGDYILRATNSLGEVTCRTTLNIKPTEKVVQLPSSTQEVTITSTRKTEKSVMKMDVTPTFTRPLQPEIRVRERTIAKLEAYVEAYPPPVITWHVNGNQIKPSPKYTVRHEGNKAILLVKNVSVEDAGLYSCKAMSELGEAVSSTTLYVTGSVPRSQPPKFVVTLQNAQGMDGKEVTFSCVVKGNPMPDIFWFHNDKSIDKNEDFVINYDRHTGKIELVIVDCLPEDAGVFKCVARNASGQDVTQATLTVTPSREDTVQAQQVPQQQTVQRQPPQDHKAKLVIQKGEKEIIRSAVESEVDRTLHQKDVKVIKRIVKKQSGQPPKFTKPIQPQVVKDSESAVFTAVVSGAPQPQIIWLKDKVPLHPSSKHVMEFDSNTGACTLTIKNSQPSDVGVYSCKAENPAGKATCTANVVVVPHDADVTITEKTVSVKKERVTVVGEQETRIIENSPTFTNPLMPEMDVNEGETVTLQCLVESDPPPSIQWFGNGQEILSTNRITIRNDQGLTSLTIQNCSPLDSGEYICKATNPLGEGYTRTTLIVRGRHTKAVHVSGGPRPVDDGSIRPDRVQPAQTGVHPPQSVVQPGPGGPVSEPCAVIATEPEAPRFTLPLRDLAVNDGDQAVFRVLYQGFPMPKITWYFNSQPIKPSRDFQIFVDSARNESTLVIVEVFPEDEGEYMVKAVNQMGAAVTHCHMFVRLPSSSSDEEGMEKIVSKTTQVLKTVEPISIKEKRRFSETISIDHKEKFREFQLQFGIPPRRTSKTEIHLQQPAQPKGLKMDVQVPGIFTEQKIVQLKQKAEALMTQRQTIQMPITKQRRYSETLAIDQTKLKPVQLTFDLPKHLQQKTTSLTVQQRPQPRGVKMEVEVPQLQRQTSALEIRKTKQIEAIEAQRQEFQMHLEGSPPRFVWELNPLKVMDGEEVKFICRVTGNPMPEVKWYHNGKLVVDNPDFKTFYDRSSGECILDILEVFPQDTGRYECIAVNKYGRAITRAFLQVEVYEYVPDSEEATASQTESVVSTSSMDEVEFQSRAQRFLENMEKLKKEIMEETETQEMEEEVIEELEIDEQGYEETVQMADVKWQYQKTAGAGDVHVQPETTEDTVDAPMAEVTREQEIITEMARSSVRGREATRVMTLHAVQPEEGAADLYAEGAETTQHHEGESVTAEFLTPQSEATPSQVAPIVEEIRPESPEEIGLVPTEETQHEEIVVEMSQPERQPATMTQVGHVEEEIRPESPEEIGLVPTEETQQEEIVVEMAQPERQPATTTQVGHVEEEIRPESPEEIGLVPTETTQEEDIFVEMAEPEVKSKEESRVEHILEVTKEGSFEGDIAELAPEGMAEEEIKVDLGAIEDKKVEASYVGMVEDYLSPDEEEEIFHLAHEAPVEGEDVPSETKTAEMKHREHMLTLTQEAHQSIEDTEVAQTEFTEDMSKEEEIIVDLAAAQKEAPAPAQTMEQESVVPPMTAEEIPDDNVSEETTQGSQVIVPMDTAAKEAARPSLVGTTEEQIEVQETKRDVEEYDEEKTKVAETPSETTEGGKVEPPPMRVEPIVEGVLPEGVTSELISNIKEVYMIPSYVQPEYEPAVVEKYRLEAQIRGQQLTDEEIQIQLQAKMAAMQKSIVEKAQMQAAQESRTQQQVIKMKVEAAKVGEEAKVEVKMAEEKTTAEMQMMAAQMATHIVRAVQEVTEEKQQVTEVVREEVEVIKKAKIQKQVEEKYRTEISAVSLMAPVFEIPLSDVTVFDGERAVLECRVTGVPMPVVQWFVDNEEIRASEEIKITYEEGSCYLEINDVLQDDEGEYKVTAINDAGTCETTAFLTVLPPSRPDSEEPELDEQMIAPERRMVPERRPKPEQMVSEEYKKVEVALSVQHKKEISEKTIMLTEPQAPVFKKQLESKEIFETLPVKLECEVIGCPEPTIVWYQNGQELKSTEHMRLEYKHGKCSLFIDKVTIEDEAEYTCEARNEYGITKSWMELLVESKHSFGKHPFFIIRKHAQNSLCASCA